jgi:dolichol-phosphate mannosyltransferase
VVKKISIIIPTKNEEGGIAKVLCSIPEDILKDGEVIVVDSSRDLTPLIAKKLGAKVISLKKDGKGFAMKKAVEASSGEILVFLDGDGSDPPEYIPKLLKKLENADIVLGTRNLKKFRGSNSIDKTIFSFYYNIVYPLFRMAGLTIDGDPLAGFRAMRRKTWDALNLCSDDFLIETEMNIKAVEHGLKIAEVHIPLIRRYGGLLNSKLATNPKQIIKIISYLLKHARMHVLNNKLSKKQYSHIFTKKILKIS